jgi:hypothetical protein
MTYVPRSGVGQEDPDLVVLGEALAPPPLPPCEPRIGQGVEVNARMSTGVYMCGWV